MKYNKLYNLITEKSIETADYIDIGHQNKDNFIWWWNFGKLHVKSSSFCHHDFIKCSDKEISDERYYSGRYDSDFRGESVCSIYIPQKFNNKVPSELIQLLKEKFNNVRKFYLFDINHLFNSNRILIKESPDDLYDYSMRENDTICTFIYYINETKFKRDFAYLNSKLADTLKKITYYDLLKQEVKLTFPLVIYTVTSGFNSKSNIYFNNVPLMKEAKRSNYINYHDGIIDYIDKVFGFSGHPNDGRAYGFTSGRYDENKNLISFWTYMQKNVVNNTIRDVINCTKDNVNWSPNTRYEVPPDLPNTIGLEVDVYNSNMTTGIYGREEQTKHTDSRSEDKNRDVRSRMFGNLNFESANEYIQNLITEANVNSLTPMIQDFLLKNMFMYKNKKYNDLTDEEKIKLNDNIKYSKDRYIEDVNSITSNPQYQSWIYELLANKLIFSEDYDKVSKLLEQFDKVKKSGNWKSSKNILDYKTFSELHKVVSEFIINNKSSVALNLGNNKLLFTNGEFKVVELIKFHDAEHLLRDTGWCVQNKDTFNYYVSPFYLILKNNKQYALIHFNSHQIKDVHDDVFKSEEVTEEFYNTIMKLIKLEWPEENYRWPKEKYIHLLTATNEDNEDSEDFYPILLNHMSKESIINLINGHILNPWKVIEYYTNKDSNDIQVQRALLNSDSRLIKYIENPSESLILSIIDNIKNKIKQDRVKYQFDLEDFLSNVKSTLYTKNIILAAIPLDIWTTLKFCPKHLLKDKEIQLAAAKLDPKATSHYITDDIIYPEVRKILNDNKICIKKVDQIMKFKELCENLLAESNTNRDYCPVCKEKYIGSCRCMQNDRHCRNGHIWLICIKHNQKLYTLNKDINTHNTNELGVSCLCEHKDFIKY